MGNATKPFSVHLQNIGNGKCDQHNPYVPAKFRNGKCDQLSACIHAKIRNTKCDKLIYNASLITTLITSLFTFLIFGVGPVVCLLFSYLGWVAISSAEPVFPKYPHIQTTNFT